jgi:hypothetical protein
MDRWGLFDAYEINMTTAIVIKAMARKMPAAITSAFWALDIVSFTPLEMDQNVEEKEKSLRNEGFGQ